MEVRIQIHIKVRICRLLSPLFANKLGLPRGHFISPLPTSPPLLEPQARRSLARPCLAWHSWQSVPRLGQPRLGLARSHFDGQAWLDLAKACQAKPGQALLATPEQALVFKMIECNGTL